MTETTTTEQLFRRWTELEPERCRESEEMFDILCGESWQSVFSLKLGDEPSLVGWGVTQAVVQKALYEGGMRFRITDVSNHLSGIPCYEVDILADDFYKIRRENPIPSWVGMRGESVTK